MAPTPEQQTYIDQLRGNFLSLNALAADLHGVADSIGSIVGLSGADLSSLEELLNEEPTEPPVEPPVEPPTDWPAGGSWEEKMAWVPRQVGIKAQELRLVGSTYVDSYGATKTFVPDGCKWYPTARRLDVHDATRLENIQVPGQITPRSTHLTPIALCNVAAEDLFAWEHPAAYRVNLVEDCHMAMPASKVIGDGVKYWGQGVLNALKGGFVVRRSYLAGGADAVQCSGGGLIEDSFIGDLTVAGPAGTGTHNDFIQNYGGNVVIRRSLFRQNLGPAGNSHLNGIFCDSGTYDIEDTAIVVTAPAGFNAWALHAAKAGHIRIRNSLVQGKIIGDIRNEGGNQFSTGY